MNKHLVIHSCDKVNNYVLLPQQQPLPLSWGTCTHNVYDVIHTVHVHVRNAPKQACSNYTPSICVSVRQCEGTTFMCPILSSPPSPPRPFPLFYRNSTQLPGYQVVAKHHSCDKLSGVNCDRETVQWKVNIQKSIAPPNTHNTCN